MDQAYWALRLAAARTHVFSGEIPDAVKILKSAESRPQSELGVHNRARALLLEIECLRYQHNFNNPDSKYFPLRADALARYGLTLTSHLLGVRARYGYRAEANAFTYWLGYALHAQGHNAQALPYLQTAADKTNSAELCFPEYAGLCGMVLVLTEPTPEKGLSYIRRATDAYHKLAKLYSPLSRPMIHCSLNMRKIVAGSKANNPFMVATALEHAFKEVEEIPVVFFRDLFRRELRALKDQYAKPNDGSP